jgi:hypothetical protein
MSLLASLRFRPLLLLLTVVTVLLVCGCATTKTTTTVETTMHSPDPAFRYQSSDVTARLQVEATL